MNLSKTLFWDANVSNINFETDATYIIERVLERGNTNEWQAVKSYYGLEKIKDVAKNLRYLSKKTLHFCSVYFDEPVDNFRSWQNQMQMPEHLRWEF